jgi:cation diffusion facilitator family transporter
MSQDQAAGVERRALLASIAVTAVLGVIGIVWGIASGSQMILLDGVYAIVGILVSLILLAGSAMARSEPSDRYPFGRESVAPLVIGVQGFVLFATLFYAAVEAVYAIARGGSSVTAGSGFLYGVIATAGSLAFWMWIHRRVGHSDVLRSEATAWKVAAFRGVGMMAGFALMWLITDTMFDWAVPYLDPAMVLVTCLVFLPAPIRLMRATLRELLEGAPPAAILREAEAKVEEVHRRFGLDEAVVRMTKVGPKLYIEVEGIADPNVTVAEEHELRTALEAELETLPLAIWLNLELLPRAPVGGVGPAGPASPEPA